MEGKTGLRGKGESGGGNMGLGGEKGQGGWGIRV